MSPRVPPRVHDRAGFIVLQLIARSTNVLQVLALRGLDQRLASRIDVSVDRHIAVIEPERDQISPHDPVDDCARLHQFRQQRAHFTLEFLMTKRSRSHWTLGIRRWTFGVFCWLLRYFSLQPFRQCRLPRSKYRRDRQLASITVLLAQRAEISRAAPIEHTPHGQGPPPSVVFAHTSATERHTFCRRFRFPLFARIQHLDHSAPDKPRALIGHPKSTRPRPTFE